MLARVEMNEIIVYFMYLRYLFGLLQMKCNTICVFSEIYMSSNIKVFLK